ncbi:DMT family transporter [Sulfitobacter sp. PR48]|jgi:drug/metabolite transporter (DMT)-like permease|uniref:DMT family transporter n=1 Tax=Sulfitobacter porphyrae TaxID=1246864 RepID=A0ABW2B099_9RHOB|nr:MULTISPECIES: DMT family transporter [unclassified Sulfitobacter]MCZ4254531.1 DMT family transporter [Sulfitobacter sp. G21635-S1]MDD9720161.1 DMT family transporter [Sulfitobacter sp. PR48]GLT09321.1 membrane protein [Sulfitobacter porphyrae]
MYQARVQNNALAAGLIGVATAFIAATTLMAKALGGDTFGAPLPALQISHGRFLFAFVVIGSATLILRPALERPHWGLHIARTACGWGGITLMFASVAFIPLADATAISFLNPVFAMMLAIPLLGEKVGRIRWSAAAMAMAGAAVLLRPTPDSFQPAALLALGAAMVMGMELIFIKKLARRENPFQILLVNNFIGLGIATLAVLPVWQPPTTAQWAVLAGIGGCMALAQTCFVNAMARADASFVAPFSYATLIFATLYDIAFFGVIPDAVSLLGAAIIIAGAVLLALREARLKPEPPRPTTAV